MQWQAPRVLNLCQELRIAAAVSSVLAPTLVLLGRPGVLVGCYILHSSAHMKPTVGLFPWDPGGMMLSDELLVWRSVVRGMTMLHLNGTSSTKGCNSALQHLGAGNA